MHAREDSQLRSSSLKLEAAWSWSWAPFIFSKINISTEWLGTLKFFSNLSSLWYHRLNKAIWSFIPFLLFFSILQTQFTLSRLEAGAWGRLGQPDTHLSGDVMETSLTIDYDKQWLNCVSAIGPRCLLPYSLRLGIDILVTKTTAVVKRISQRNLYLNKWYFRLEFGTAKNMFQNDNNLINFCKVT